MPDKSKPTVLNLVRWYPNRYDPMPGLFIQKHVEAAGNYCNVAVVYTHMVEKDDPQNEIYSTDYSIINGVPTAKVYYRSSHCVLLPVRKLINICRFFRANQKGIHRVKMNNGTPDLIHVHILTRLGLIALYNKIKNGTPYIITEHWSRYLNLTGDFKGLFRKYTTRIIAKKASAITAVTQNLAEAMRSHKLENRNFIVLPNVVDETFLSNKSPSINRDNKITLLHVSCFEDKSKNISGLLRVVSRLSERRNDFIFRMVGDGMDFNSMKKMSEELGLNEEIIQFTGLLEGAKLVEEMNNADILVIFSNYENMPVVINESFSLGVPVIATKVGGIPEVVNASNGILVEPGDEDQLLDALQKIADREIEFDTEELAQMAKSTYSPKAIGNILFNIYDGAIS